MSLYVPVNGVWKNTVPYVPVAGAWRQVPQIYVPVNGAWKALYTYHWQVGSWGGCSVACGGGTQTRSVVCRRTQDNTRFANNVCTSFGAGAKPITSQPCNTQSCVSCRYSSTAPVSYFLCSPKDTRVFVDGNVVCQAASQDCPNSTVCAPWYAGTFFFCRTAIGVQLCRYEVCGPF